MRPLVADRSDVRARGRVHWALDCETKAIVEAALLNDARCSVNPSFRQDDRDDFNGPLDYLLFLVSVLLAIAVMIAFGT